MRQKKKTDYHHAIIFGGFGALFAGALGFAAWAKSRAETAGATPSAKAPKDHAPAAGAAPAPKEG